MGYSCEVILWPIVRTPLQFLRLLIGWVSCYFWVGFLDCWRKPVVLLLLGFCWLGRFDVERGDFGRVCSECPLATGFEP